MPALMAGTSPILHWLGLISFYWFVLTAFWGPDGRYTALFLLILYFLSWARNYWSLLRRSSLFWSILVLFLFLVMRVGWDYVVGSRSLTWHNEYGWPFLTVSGVFAFVVAPWMVGESGRHRLDWAVGLLVLSLGIQVCQHAFLHEGSAGLATFSEFRPGFQMGPNSFGALCGALLIASIPLARRWLRILSGCRGAVRWVACGAMLTVQGLLLGGLLISQARASWLGVVVALPLVLWGLFAAGFGKERSRLSLRNTAPYAIAILVIGAALVYQGWDMVHDRITHEMATVTTVLQSGLAEVPDSSAGKRIQMWQAGVMAFPEHPLIGFGPSAVTELIESGTEFSYRHLHNFPLQVLLSFGVLGLGLFLLPLFLVAREVLAGLQAGRLDHDWALFWGGTLVFWAVQGMFELSIHDTEVQSYFIVIAAIGISLQWQRLMLSAQTAQPRRVTSAAPPTWSTQANSTSR